MLVKLYGNSTVLTVDLKSFYRIYIFIFLNKTKYFFLGLFINKFTISYIVSSLKNLIYNFGIHVVDLRHAKTIMFCIVHMQSAGFKYFLSNSHVF